MTKVVIQVVVDYGHKHWSRTVAYEAIVKRFKEPTNEIEEAIEWAKQLTRTAVQT